MALEPKIPSGRAEPDPDLAAFTRWDGYRAKAMDSARPPSSNLQLSGDAHECPGIKSKMAESSTFLPLRGRGGFLVVDGFYRNKNCCHLLRGISTENSKRQR
jgi:hypothetical protein